MVLFAQDLGLTPNKHLFCCASEFYKLSNPTLHALVTIAR
jgi:hypothetical protein